ncbi:biotin/lipoyl-binding protein [Anaerobutyricum hallii]|uniref:Biotin/lipoyl-binding protein n=1 Tax=Anaerobutyricum hallii TaxID=39488 RepID=A0A413PXV4_9FIRM|nr:biotin/lipoyl-binding protein [Anaerobutyricum hallii]RGZ82735.1 biotin/lipoyl-binding protein [Anaerobutyricum hallii]
MKGKKKILLAVALVLVMAVGITSIVVIRNRNKTVVKVFPVSMLNSSDWFDTDTSLTGTLTSDYIQEVHIDGGQKVKKVYVKKGDKVKKGDILLKYNVSEKELDLKLQKLQIQSSKMEIAEMEKELKKLKNTKTVGAVNTGNSDVMNASVNLSAIKGTSLSYLVAEANGNTEGTSSDVKVQSGNAVSKSGSGSGSESGSGSGSGSESGSGSGSGSESGSGSGETKLVLRDHVNSEADKAATSGAGTKEDDSLIFTLTKNGTISGAFVKKLISEGKYAEFRSYKSEESKNPIATFELSPDTKVNVYDNDNYTVNKLNEGGDSRTLHNSIESVSERDSSSGDGSSAGNAYIYYLNVNGRVKGSVIKSLHDSKKYATFIEFDENGKEKNRYEYNPDRVFTDLEEDGLYKVSDFDNLTIRPAYKDLKADKLEDGQKDSNGKYIFYLQKGGKISGSLLNDLIKKGINAEFIEYASEKDYDNENTENANTLEITSSSKFTVELADGTGYTISYLKSKVKKDDPSKPTTEHENPTTPSTDKKIKFKQNRKRVTAGNGCLLTVVTEDGKSIDQSKVTWKLSDNISKDTTITKTKSGVWLYVDEGEPSSSVTITAQVKNVKGISKEQISRTLIVKGADTGDDGDDNNGGGSDDGSGSGSGDGIDDGTDSSGGDDNGYTAEELKAAISDKEDDIAQAKEDLHDAQISYKEAKAEVDKATVKAKLAGTVTTAYSKGTLPTDGSAAIVVKAADGMYVKTSISEMELDSVKVGGTIKCVSSDTGDEYTAEVKEISDFPTADSSNGGDVSNPNSSYYPIVAFIKDADGLSPGGSVEVSYSSKSMGTANENAVYLQKAYIRTEDKKSYVYLRDKKTKRLKKQYITIGKTMNGQYIEIVSGVTEDDNIAFPYGKNLREGVKTKISEDDSEMIY